jgi:hypothetical protein
MATNAAARLLRHPGFPSPADTLPLQAADAGSFEQRTLVGLGPTAGLGFGVLALEDLRATLPADDSMRGITGSSCRVPAVLARA